MAMLFSNSRPPLCLSHALAKRKTLPVMLARFINRLCETRDFRHTTGAILKGFAPRAVISHEKRNHNTVLTNTLRLAVGKTRMQNPLNPEV
jgi:hypothetical protein